MKVIKSGTGQKGWAREIACKGYRGNGGGCGALLLVEQADLFKVHLDGDYTEVGPPSIAFKCPECGQCTDIDSKFYSGYVQQLPDKRDWEATHESKPGWKD
jgi:hypothetical protein